LVGYKKDFGKKRKYINHTETGQTLKSHKVQSKFRKGWTDKWGWVLTMD